jgi:Calcineurin-like phosphoesterase
MPAMRSVLGSFAMILGAAAWMTAMTVMTTMAGGCDRNRERRPASSASPVAPRPLAEPPATSDGVGKGGPSEVTGEPPAAAAAAPATTAAAPASVAEGPMAIPGCELAAEPLRLPGGKRIVAIGDVHGDLRAFTAALVAAKAVNAKGRWIGKDLIVVQTGDILDRGDDEQAILDWMERLEGEARAAGGAFHWLLGNHELMNAAGDFRYVTPAGFVDFQDVPALELTLVAKAPPEMQARAAAFAVGPRTGPYARVLAGQETVRIVGDTVFSHAGVVGKWAAQLERVNLENRCWLAGELPPPAPPPALIEDDSPVWTRELGGELVDCEALTRTLAALGAARMVVGHTVQPTGISSACDGKLWRIDVGLSAHYDGPIQVLEISAAAGKTEAKAVAGTRPAAPPASGAASK